MWHATDKREMAVRIVDVGKDWAWKWVAIWSPGRIRRRLSMEGRHLSLTIDRRHPGHRTARAHWALLNGRRSRGIWEVGLLWGRRRLRTVIIAWRRWWPRESLLRTHW